MIINEYGSLCTEMYEALHMEAPQDELAFYLSFARKGQKILEPLCGSGRFLIPFYRKGFPVCGMDRSGEMLQKLKEKFPEAQVFQGDLAKDALPDCYDYIFIPAGSITLFTNPEICLRVLRNLNAALCPGGQFVFSVDTTSCRQPDDPEYLETSRVLLKGGEELLLKTQNRYDPLSQTQFSPGIYELYRKGALLRQEKMDFQMHLYTFGEMDSLLVSAGFRTDAVYRSFQKEKAEDGESGMLLYVCSRA